MATSLAQILDNKTSLPNELPLEFFEKITDDFSYYRLIGEGSFGLVYKGILADGGEVAVKKLHQEGPVQAAKLFANEVQNFKVPEHENIVKLVAFCRESGNKPVLLTNGGYRIAPVTQTVLCYEYFPNRSLDKHIYASGGSNTIGWNTRFNIIKGISNGIQCLHSLHLVHLGLKPQNILLDGSMVPKIADFVFSRIFDRDETRKRTESLVGTEGYMAPEYVQGREISAQSDIYSFGLIILEIVTREKNNSQKHARQYIDDVKNNWTSEKIMSEYGELNEEGLRQVEACIEIGLRCVELDQHERPRIQEIINDLSGQMIAEVSPLR